MRRVPPLVCGKLFQDRGDGRGLATLREPCDDARAHAFVERSVDERVGRELCKRDDAHSGQHPLSLSFWKRNGAFAPSIDGARERKAKLCVSNLIEGVT